MRAVMDECNFTWRSFATQTIAEGRRIVTPEGIELLEQVDVGDGDPQWSGHAHHAPGLGLSESMGGLLHRGA
ncbi:MAG: hypothetical protein ACK52R_03855, partial [Betaproteobacteria bacterium]